MVSKKLRLRVVLDTNIFVRAFKSRSPTSPNQRVVRLWLLEKRLQLIVSHELIEEYLDIFRDVLGLDDDLVGAWRARFTADSRSTVVNLGRRYTESRDPDDNVVLATARSGRASFLVTNDLDLLELPEAFRRTLRFEVATPTAFLRRYKPR